MAKDTEKWAKIKDNEIRHIWVKADDDDCDCGPVEISPDWYEQNGTPVCECGQDMVYSHTEIKAGTYWAPIDKEK